MGLLLKKIRKSSFLKGPGDATSRGGEAAPPGPKVDKTVFVPFGPCFAAWGGAPVFYTLTFHRAEAPNGGGEPLRLRPTGGGELLRLRPFSKVVSLASLWGHTDWRLRGPLHPPGSVSTPTGDCELHSTRLGRCFPGGALSTLPDFLVTRA